MEESTQQPEVTKPRRNMKKIIIISVITVLLIALISFDVFLFFKINYVNQRRSDLETGLNSLSTYLTAAVEVGALPSAQAIANALQNAQNPQPAPAPEPTPPNAKPK